LKIDPGFRVVLFEKVAPKRWLQGSHRGFWIEGVSGLKKIKSLLFLILSEYGKQG
jgi:hypothetical protein